MTALNKTFPVINRESQLLSSSPQSLEKIYDEIKREHIATLYVSNSAKLMCVEVLEGN